AANELFIYDITGKLIKKVDLPNLGSISGFSGKYNDEEAFFSYMSYIQPPILYRLNLKTLEISIFKEVATRFKPENYIWERFSYTSKDGTKIPIFVSHRKDLPMDGLRPTLLYGYGGFNISLTPSFNMHRGAILMN